MCAYIHTQRACVMEEVLPAGDGDQVCVCVCVYVYTHPSLPLTFAAASPSSSLDASHRAFFSFAFTHTHTQNTQGPKTVPVLVSAIHPHLTNKAIKTLHALLPTPEANVSK
jgi:hypothetical protein